MTRNVAGGAVGLHFFDAKLLSGDALQPSRRERVRHQSPNAIAVERNDEKHVELAEKVVNRADGGHDHAASVAVRQVQHRYSEIQVLVVSPGNDFIFAEQEDRPDANLLPDDVSILDLGVEDFRRGRCIQAGKRGCLVPDDEEQFHPQRVMREDGQEHIGDAEILAVQRHPEGITEIRAFDQLAAQHADGRHIAFNDFHTKLAKQLVANFLFFRARPQAEASGYQR
jgi:hypothetical protein